MKKIFLLIIAGSFIIKNVSSQITKGYWMLGGNVNYSSTRFSSENFGMPHNYNNLQIRLNVGYFVIDKFATGIKVGIEKTNVKEPGTSGDNKYTNLNVGPFFRYYFLNPDKNVNILSEGMYQYGFEKGNTLGLSKSSFSISAGPVIYFNSVVGLEFLISYSTYKFSGIKGSNNTIMIGVGLQVHLEKEKK